MVKLVRILWVVLWNSALRLSVKKREKGKKTEGTMQTPLCPWSHTAAQRIPTRHCQEKAR